MFDIGWTEIFVIAAVAIIVVGPRDLPKMLRQFGQAVGQVRRMAGDFQDQFKDALREAELDDLKKDFDDVRRASSLSGVKSALNPLEDTARDIKRSIEEPVKADEAETAKPAAREKPPADEKAAAPADTAKPTPAAAPKPAPAKKPKPAAAAKSKPATPRKTAAAAAKPKAQAKTSPQRRTTKKAGDGTSTKAAG